MSINKIFDCLIIGSGPAGSTAAVYSARGGLKTAMILGNIKGGQMTNTSFVENFPGFKKIEGEKLTSLIIDHAEHTGTVVIQDYVLEIKKEANTFLVKTLEKNIFQSKTIIFATGASPKKLNIETEVLYTNRGVHYCAICDGIFYKNKRVAVVGGGNNAVESALFLSNFVERVYVLHRRNVLRAEIFLQDQLFKKNNIEILWEKSIVEFCGDKQKNEKLNHIIIEDKNKKKENLIVSGVFIAIGTTPNSSLAKELVEIDKDGYIITNKKMETLTPGVFVAGDVCDPYIKQAVVAAGHGCIAALSAIEFLNKNS